MPRASGAEWGASESVPRGYRRMAGGMTTYAGLGSSPYPDSSSSAPNRSRAIWSQQSEHTSVASILCSAASWRMFLDGIHHTGPLHTEQRTEQSLPRQMKRRWAQ